VQSVGAPDELRNIDCHRLADPGSQMQIKSDTDDHPDSCIALKADSNMKLRFFVEVCIGLQTSRKQHGSIVRCKGVRLRGCRIPLFLELELGDAGSVAGILPSEPSSRGRAPEWKEDGCNRGKDTTSLQTIGEYSVLARHGTIVLAH
jgi:hypothetical protein